MSSRYTEACLPGDVAVKRNVGGGATTTAEENGDGWKVTRKGEYLRRTTNILVTVVMLHA